MWGEGWLSFLFKCVVSIETWYAAGLHNLIDSKHTLDLTPLNMLMCIFSTEDASTVSMVVMVIWCLWFNRNAWIWNDKNWMQCKLPPWCVCCWQTGQRLKGLSMTVWVPLQQNPVTFLWWMSSSRVVLLRDSSSIMLAQVSTKFNSLLVQRLCFAEWERIVYSTSHQLVLCHGAGSRRWGCNSFGSYGLKTWASFKLFWVILKFLWMLS